MPRNIGGMDSLMLRLSALKKREVGRGVGDAHLLEAEIGGRQQVQLDVAVDLHLAADDARGLLLEIAAIAVPVDEIRNGEQRADDGYDKDGNGDEQVVHRPAPPPCGRRLPAAHARAKRKRRRARSRRDGCLVAATTHEPVPSGAPREAGLPHPDAATVLSITLSHSYTEVWTWNLAFQRSFDALWEAPMG